MGLLTKLFKLICSFTVIFVAVLLGPSNLPDTATFTEFTVAPVKYLGENLKDNDILNNAERLFEDEIKGPEAFEIVNGELYTTLHGGYVAKVFDDQVIPVVKFGQPCEGWWEESKCGRPLGLKAYGKDHLIVADAYYGIFKYNIKTGKSVSLVDKNTVIDGKKPKIFNSVEVARDGSIYWTSSSSDFDIENGIFTFLADGSGRLLKYDPVTQKNTVLLDGLYFANGLVLSPEEDYLLVSETGHSRILKFYLKGPKKFAKEIFIDGLPGMPDNLRINSNSVLVPLVVTRDESHPASFQVITPFPKLRRFAAQFLSVVELCFHKIHEIYPNYFIKRALHCVGHFESVGMLLPLKTTVLEVDLSGNVIRSYHGNDGSVTSVSDVIAHNGYLWLGSPVNNYLARIKLSKVPEGFIKKQSGQFSGTETKHRVTTPAPVTTTRPPPPTTTRSPPSTTRSPPPPPTTRPSPPPTTRSPPPPPTTRSTPPPTTRSTPPPTTRSPPTPPTTRPSPPPTTRSTPPPPTNRPPPPSTKSPPPPPPTNRPSPPPTTKSPPTSTTRSPPPEKNTVS